MGVGKPEGDWHLQLRVLAALLARWAFAYGDPFTTDAQNKTVYQSNPFIGSRQFAMSGLEPTNLYKWLFQVMKKGGSG